MAIQHKDIADPDIHELKGVAVAPLGSFAKANNGVTVWAFDEDFIDLDIATLDVAADYHIIIPHSGTVLKAYSVIDSPIGTSNTTITMSTGGIAMINGVITIPFAGSAAGQINSCTPTGGNTVAGGQAIKLAVNGVSTGASRCHVAIVFLRTA